MDKQDKILKIVDLIVNSVTRVTNVSVEIDDYIWAARVKTYGLPAYSEMCNFIMHNQKIFNHFNIEIDINGRFFYLGKPVRFMQQ